MRFIVRTSWVSFPPTMLRPSPDRPFEISITVSCPGTMGHVAGSEEKKKREMMQLACSKALWRIHTAAIKHGVGDSSNTEKVWIQKRCWTFAAVLEVWTGAAGRDGRSRGRDLQRTCGGLGGVPLAFWKTGDLRTIRDGNLMKQKGYIWLLHPAAYCTFLCYDAGVSDLITFDTSILSCTRNDGTLFYNLCDVTENAGTNEWLPQTRGQTNIGYQCGAFCHNEWFCLKLSSLTCSTWGLGDCSLVDSNTFSVDLSFWNDL